MRALLVLLTLIVPAGVQAGKDALRTADGVILGKLLRANSKQVVFRKDDGEQVILKRSDVRQLIRGNAYQEYLLRRDKAKTVKERIALARWCAKRELYVEADALRQLVLAEDPTNEKVWAAAGYVRMADEWVDPACATAVKRAPYPKDFTWSLEWDATERDMKHWQDIVRKSAQHLWETSEGQIWLRSVTLIDKSKKGEVHVDKTSEHPKASSHIRLARGWYPQGQHFTFVHAFGHVFLGLPDEYAKEGQPSPPTEAHCVMGRSSFAGWCDKKNHKWPGTDCWTLVKRRLSKMQHPNAFPKQAPPVRIVVENR